MAPSNVDPTRTITLRRSFVRDLRRAFAALRKDLYDLIVGEDAFGVGNEVYSPPVVNAKGAGGGKGGKGKLSGGEWRTIHGAHVYLKGGKIVAGPSHLVGKKPNDIRPPAEGTSAKTSRRSNGSSGHGDGRVLKLTGYGFADIKVVENPNHAQLEKWLTTLPGGHDRVTGVGHVLKLISVGDKVYVAESYDKHTGLEVTHQDIHALVGERGNVSRHTSGVIRFRDKKVVLESYLVSKEHADPAIHKWVAERGITFVANVSTDTYQYPTVQVDIEDVGVLRVLAELQRGIAPEDLVKIEDESHVTVRYGLYDGGWTLDSVKALTQGVDQVAYRIGSLSYFKVEKEGKDSVDVLKFSVESEDLVELNRRLGLLPNKQDYVYSPHMTVAYLKAGSAEQYLGATGIEGRDLSATRLTYSSSQKERTVLPLGGPVTNRRWKYLSQEQAVDNFDKYLHERVARHLMSKAESERWAKYIEKGFHKGEGRAFDDTARTRKTALGTRGTRRAGGFVEGDREAFLRQSIGKAAASEKLRMLRFRALSEVRGMGEDLRTKARRALTDGLVAGEKPGDIAKRLSKVLDISLGRAETIALTELVRAHAEGQLEAMEQLGVESVGVAVEWSTASDPCKMCEPLKGIVLTVREARGMLPRHPRCRCAWVPANIGEDAADKKNQKRSKTKIVKAIRQSDRAEGDVPDQQWGPGAAIAKTRPVSEVFNHSSTCSCCEGVRTFGALLRSLTSTTE